MQDLAWFRFLWARVHLFYRARLLSDQFNPGIETIEARLFAEHEIPSGRDCPFSHGKGKRCCVTLLCRPPARPVMACTPSISA